MTTSPAMKWFHVTLPLFLLLTKVAFIAASHGRTQYHEQGLHGHSSYKFGFDTGDHYNPQSRHEERDGHGNVHGHFSYVDGKGKKITVHYKSDKYGFYRSDDPANNEKKHSKKWKARAAKAAAAKAAAARR